MRGVQDLDEDADETGDDVHQGAHALSDDQGPIGERHGRGDGRVRCGWAEFTGTRSAAPDSVLYRDYHDYEWGSPLHGA